MFNWSSVLPEINNEYLGSKLSLYFLVLLACMFTFRGIVHYFAPDGGSGIIAGIPLESYSEGATEAIVTSFGVYGIYHLLEAAMAWLIILRYRALVPLFFLYILTSQLLGTILITVKPLPVVPPGQTAVYIIFPLTFIFFLLSIKKNIAPKEEKIS